MNQPIITLTTDFGTMDGYIGAMKGLILSINPKVNIVDITHEIDAQDILSAALTLRHSCRAFPKETIHVAVVDPGVGSKRKPLLLQTESYFYVGPDNGIFSLTIDGAALVQAVELKTSKYFFTPTSDTFHGRDIFAPVAAYLSLGIDPMQFGPLIEEHISLSIPKPTVSTGEIEGQVLHIDRFGNLMTNVDKQVYGETVREHSVSIEIGTRTLDAVCHSYADVEEGTPLAIFGSSGFLEIAVNTGSAQESLKLKRGDQIRIIVRP